MLALFQSAQLIHEKREGSGAGIRTSDLWIRMVQNKADLADPDPQHWLCVYLSMLAMLSAALTGTVDFSTTIFRPLLVSIVSAIILAASSTY